MKILKKSEFEKLLKDNPDKRFVFWEYEPDVLIEQIHVTDGDPEHPGFGATSLADVESYEMNDDDILFNYDWNINEYYESDQFYVLNDQDVRRLIDLLMKAASGDIQ